jgi:hypothetical protein
MTRSRIGLAILLAFASAPWFGGIARLSAAEDAACPEGDEWVECKAKAGDRMAIYVLGRNAYESARESGDFSEALRLSRQLAVTGDKNGERLLKMVHMQLGWGAHKDYVQAYVWLSEAIAGGSDYLVTWREMLTEKMTPEQLAKAKERTGQ